MQQNRRRNRMGKGKKILIVLAVLCLLAAAYSLTYLPRHVVRLDADRVNEIVVFNGSTGRRIEISDRDEIRHIVESLNDVVFQKDKLSVGYMGYGLRTTFIDAKGKRIDELIINSDKRLRYRGFFYNAYNGQMPHGELLQKFE
ncbi:hypothetical protein QWJ34_12235 [Saccharibacillus sp. CPCC 101409]|uniref:hypothetical protein n=1 Tax=Saccharibacillus sp. CPCC 101409 TaxID=3058041 RepID=UPI002672CEDD|nr:hypothetical protein [Saccharibacillus sp. CPCC 101409]MDO3410531.1 hypothetical protein [Saccharibacillus sp. CPCC 101409]